MSESQQKKVNLFVVGAMKAGTTSFVEMLSQHSDIYVPPIKEPHYFVDDLPKTIYNPSRFFDIETYFKEKFPEPLHIANLSNSMEYEKAYSLSTSESLRVDGSTAYLHSKETAKRIFEYNNDAKIIIIIRDPLERAFSHYNMNLGKGRVKESFSDVMKQDIEAYNLGNIDSYSYLAMSMYDTAIERYKKTFQDVLVLHFDHIHSKKDENYTTITSFLGITPFLTSENEHKNKSRSLRFQKVFYLLKKLGLKDYFSAVVPKKLRHKLFLAVSTDKKQQMGLSDEIKIELEEIFKKESSLC